MKFKKPLLIVAIVLDVAITIALFVISIIMLAKTAQTETTADIDGNTFIGYLQLHTTFYLWVFVVPLFVLLALNIVGLVIYVRRTTKKEPVKVDDLSDEQKEALRKELLKELAGENNKEDKQE